MKIKYIFILFILFSCSEKIKEKKTAEVSIEVVDTSERVENIKFNEIINEIELKKIPLIDTTNFNNFDAKSFYNREEVKVLKLEKLYPIFFKEGYNYKATASYKINISNEFHTLVISILKGENEMESVLVNYNLNRELIDFKVISYDEIAEGWVRIESKIEKNTISIKNIQWIDEKQETTEIFEVNGDGKIVPKSIK